MFRSLYLKFGKETKMAFGLIIFCFFNYFYLIPSQVIEQGSQPTYPLVVNTFILLSSVGYLFQSIYQKNILAINNQKNRIFSEKKKSIIIIIFVVIWVLLLEYLGFLISTIMFLIASITVCSDSRNYTKIFILSILFSLFLYFLFTVFLKTMLPEGFLESILENIF